ncbi:MAG: putative penicillin acylase, partial [Solirubrobacterales bacterium]|nr:putative penicillin acylase [Solirubrobacterales bacterium]
LLDGLRNVPVMSWLTTADRTCLYSAQLSLLSRLAVLGYRYSALTFDGIDHNGLASASLGDAQPLADFLGDARVERDPERVTYVVNAAVSEPEYGMRADHAYWLSDIRAVSPSVRGRIDVSSAGVGRRDPGPPAAVRGTGALAGGLSFAVTSQLGGDPQADRPARRLRVVAHGIRAATIDTGRAHSGCEPGVRFATRELLRLRLAGCNTTYSGKTVCHSTPVFDVVVRAPRGERAESLKVMRDGRRLPLHGKKKRLDLRGHPSSKVLVRVKSVDGQGRTQIRATTHVYCGGR